MRHDRLVVAALAEAATPSFYREVLHSLQQINHLSKLTSAIHAIMRTVFRAMLSILDCEQLLPGSSASGKMLKRKEAQETRWGEEIRAVTCTALPSSSRHT